MWQQIISSLAQPFRLHSLYRHWKHSVVSFGISFVMQKELGHNGEICSLGPLSESCWSLSLPSVPCIEPLPQPLPFIYWCSVHLCFIELQCQKSLHSSLHPHFQKAPEGFSIDFLFCFLPHHYSAWHSVLEWSSKNLVLGRVVVSIVKDCLAYVRSSEREKKLLLKRIVYTWSNIKPRKLRKT